MRRRQVWSSSRQAAALELRRSPVRVWQAPRSGSGRAEDASAVLAATFESDLTCHGKVTIRRAGSAILHHPPWLTRLPADLPSAHNSCSGGSWFQRQTPTPICDQAANARSSAIGARFCPKARSYDRGEPRI
jgi:hypothetical protein